MSATLSNDQRQPISAGLRTAIAANLATITPGKRAAMIVVADEKGARLHVAGHIGGNWKVAFEAGKPWDGPVTGQVMILWER